jgi:ankyrin repeat protein
MPAARLPDNDHKLKVHEQGENKMRKRVGLIVLASLFALSSIHAQTTDFFELVKTGTPQDVQAAIDMGADPNGRSSNGLTPLMIAAAYNTNPEVIKTLLKAGADLKARDLYNMGATVFVWAAWGNSNPEVITTLLKAGADVYSRDTEHNRSALLWAATNNANPEVIIVLLKAGADAKAKDNSSQTVLDYAQGNEKLKDTDAYRMLQEASK